MNKLLQIRKSLCLSRKTFSTIALNLNLSEKKSKYESVIGLEVHAQILTESKLFSRGSTQFLASPNSQVTYFDLSLPGTLPVLNRQCVDLAIKTGLALNCSISSKSTFDRKHYFYGDTPNGYQITQQLNPIAYDGYIEFIVYDDYFLNTNHHRTNSFEPYLKRCRLKQIQIEQDSGKSLLDKQFNINLIDLNRAGVALMELVFEPELATVTEATALVRELRQILKSIDACSGLMEEGALRVDANISIRKSGSDQVGTRTEIKNLNSFRFIRQALLYEIERQSALLEKGHSITNETLGYDVKHKQTFVMRDKEIVQDYRFMPEPNLPSIVVFDSKNKEESKHNWETVVDLDELKQQMPTLPIDVRKDLQSKKHQLTLKQIYFLMNDDSTWLHLFRQIKNVPSREIVSFFMDFLKPMILDAIDPLTLHKIDQIDVSLKNIEEKIFVQPITQLIELLYHNRISKATTVDLLKMYLKMGNEKNSPIDIVQQCDWWLITDYQRIEQACRQVIDMHPKIAGKYALTGVRKPRSILVQKCFLLMNNRVNENDVWHVFDRILRNNHS